jgi:hypothetical protein
MERMIVMMEVMKSNVQRLKFVLLINLFVEMVIVLKNQNFVIIKMIVVIRVMSQVNVLALVS